VSAVSTDAEQPSTARPALARALLARRRARDSSPLLVSAYSLGVNSVLTAGLGMAFWVVAARTYPSTSVGQDSALLAAMMQISMVAQLNMANAVVRFMPGHSAGGRLLFWAYVSSSTAAVLFGAGFVFLAPLISDDFAFLTREPLTGLAYVAAVAFWGVFALQDCALIALGHAPWVPLKNGVFGLLKLAALPLMFAIGSAHGVFAAWIVPMFLLLVPVNWLIFRRLLVRYRATRESRTSPAMLPRRRLASFLALDYLATVFAQTSLAVLPILVVAILGTRANAHFYIPFSIAIALDAAFFSISMSLVAEGALAPARVPALVRLLVRRALFIVLPLVTLLFVAAPLVMRLFGEEYAGNSTPVLRILLCAGLCRAVVALVGAIWRLNGSTGRIAALDGCMLLGVAATTVPLAQAMGVVGVALAWLGTTLVVACVGLPVLIRYLRS